MKVVSFGNVQIDVDSIEVVDLCSPKRTRMPKAFVILRRTERVPSTIFWEGTAEYIAFTKYMLELPKVSIVTEGGIEVTVAAAFMQAKEGT